MAQQNDAALLVPKLRGSQAQSPQFTQGLGADEASHRADCIESAYDKKERERDVD